MEAKDELINEILMINKECGTEQYKQHLWIVFNNYDISKAQKEIAIYEGDYNEKVLNMFLMDKALKGLSKNTLANYKNTITMFFDECDKSVLQIRPDDIKIFLANKLLVNKVTKTTQKNYLRVLSSFFGWARKEEIISINPTEKVDMPKIDKIKKKAFKEEEIEILRNNITDLRDKAIFETLLSTWCRISELVSINISDIQQDGSITVIGKGNKSRKVFLNAKAKVAIDNYLATRTDNNDALFVGKREPHERCSICGVELMIRKTGREFGIENTHPHRFRRTGATYALRSGMPVQDVSMILGHESIDTTMIYLDIDEKQIEMSHLKYGRM